MHVWLVVGPKPRRGHRDTGVRSFGGIVRDDREAILSPEPYPTGDQMHMTLEPNWTVTTLEANWTAPLRTYGQLTPNMKVALATYVQGKHVYDLGAGTGHLAVKLLQVGKAKAVTAVDKDPIEAKHKRLSKLTQHLEMLDLPDRIDVGFVSWPVNRPIRGLVRTLRRCDVVIYLGYNDAFTACGSPDLFPYLLTRKLEAYIAGDRNNMVIVGAPLPPDQTREPTAEEAAGLHLWKLMDKYKLEVP